MGIYSHIQIPNTILKHFRDETDPEKKVWYLDITDQTIRRKSAKRLGTSKGYYSLDGEQFWKHTIEDQVGNLNKQVLDFSAGKIERLTFCSNDMDVVKRYILAAIVRSKPALNSIKDAVEATEKYTAQFLHDAISVLGMEYSKDISDMLNFDSMISTVLVNRTDRNLVVPRNCFYCIEKDNQPNYVMPISPKAALLLLPKSQLENTTGNYAVTEDPEMVLRLNRHALKYECLLNKDFVASSCYEELESLQELLYNPPWEVNN